MKLPLHLAAFALLTAAASGNAFAKDGDIKTEGVISARTATTVTVSGLQFTINSATECYHINSRVNCSELAVGDSVEVKSRVGQIAREIERRSASPSPTPSVSPTPSSSPSPSPTGDDNGGDRDGRNDDNRGGNSQKISHRATIASDDAASLASGKASYSSKRNKSEFEINLKIPQGTTPAINTIEEAQALQLSAIIARNGADYAVCSFRADNRASSMRRAGLRVLRFEFKVDVRSKSGSIRNKKGSCDTDLATEGVQAGVPAIESGDTIRVNEPLVGDFVNGTF